MRSGCSNAKGGKDQAWRPRRPWLMQPVSPLQGSATTRFFTQRFALGYVVSLLRGFRIRPADLVAEGLAGFQGVGDALLSFLLAAEADEGFALEVEQVLLADELGLGERAARENVREFARDVRVVFGDEFAA